MCSHAELLELSEEIGREWRTVGGDQRVSDVLDPVQAWQRDRAAGDDVAQRELGDGLRVDVIGAAVFLELRLRRLGGACGGRGLLRERRELGGGDGEAVERAVIDRAAFVMEAELHARAERASEGGAGGRRA